jgi:hypothetical protein
MTISIMCEYSRRDIDSILDGNFKEADSTSFWRELPRDHVPEGVPKSVRQVSFRCCIDRTNFIVI